MRVYWQDETLCVQPEFPEERAALLTLLTALLPYGGPEVSVRPAEVAGWPLARPPEGGWPPVAEPPAEAS